MAKERTHRTRITVEVDPKVDAFLKQWAREEGRGLSNLLRRVLSAIADKRMAARDALAEIEQQIR
jgi:hypothetical protein